MKRAPKRKRWAPMSEHRALHPRGRRTDGDYWDRVRGLATKMIRGSIQADDMRLAIDAGLYAAIATLQGIVRAEGGRLDSSDAAAAALLERIDLVVNELERTRRHGA